MSEQESSERFDESDYMHGFYNGVAEERERIIKLLEKTADIYLADKLLVEASIILNAIAAIKGENK